MSTGRADAIVGLLVTTTLVVGGGLTWQAYQRRRAFDQMGSMMGTSMEGVHGTSPLWYALGTVLVAAVIVGGYLTVRDDRAGPEPRPRPRDSGSEPATEAPAEAAEAAEAKAPADAESPAAETETPADAGRPAGAETPEERPRARVLDLLPEDERRVLEPVLSSPGVTQIELRDRSGFSKSKVSQTVSGLEKRGLLYREQQGRTYRIYPSDELRETER